jgi:hypothetical protein
MPGKIRLFQDHRVEIRHGHDLGRIAAGVDVVGIEQETEIALHGHQSAGVLFWDA